MREKILDILEKHYHGRNHIESRCADELEDLFSELLLTYESYSANKIVGKEDKRVSKQLVDDFLANYSG